MLVDERERRLGRLAVALDRRCLAVAGHAVVGHRDVDDVRVVGRLARDDERLGEVQPTIRASTSTARAYTGVFPRP